MRRGKSEESGGGGEGGGGDERRKERMGEGTAGEVCVVLKGDCLAG